MKRKTNGKALADYIKNSGDFPDNELADNVEKASKQFRKDLKL